eukprot:2572397-Pleurochrysis_carterae.AAC.1
MYLCDVEHFCLSARTCAPLRDGSGRGAQNSSLGRGRDCAGAPRVVSGTRDCARSRQGFGEQARD